MIIPESVILAAQDKARALKAELKKSRTDIAEAESNLERMRAVMTLEESELRELAAFLAEASPDTYEDWFAELGVTR